MKCVSSMRLPCLSTNCEPLKRSSAQAKSILPDRCISLQTLGIWPCHTNLTHGGPSRTLCSCISGMVFLHLKMCWRGSAAASSLLMWTPSLPPAGPSCHPAHCRGRFKEAEFVVSRQIGSTSLLAGALLGHRGATMLPLKFCHACMRVTA